MALSPVRRLRIEDAGWAGALAVEAGFPAYRSERLAEALAEARTLGVAATDGPTGIGFALYALVPPEAELHLIAVAPARRRSGVAARLLRSGAAQLRRRGVRQLYLEVSSRNLAAQALYAALGFSAAGLRPAYYADGSDARILSRSLSAE
mgnify:FL=1